mmetsp:Transcript_30904/g.54027  ORF Transcript_30904/g.54027 Transcript_30904/m.54027 type:complete len:83 (+) Transcript_30904:64-312(+)
MALVVMEMATAAGAMAAGGLEEVVLATGAGAKVAEEMGAEVVMEVEVVEETAGATGAEAMATEVVVAAVTGVAVQRAIDKPL